MIHETFTILIFLKAKQNTNQAQHFDHSSFALCHWPTCFRDVIARNGILACQNKGKIKTITKYRSTFTLECMTFTCLITLFIPHCMLHELQLVTSPTVHLWIHVLFSYVKCLQARFWNSSICAKLIQSQQQTHSKGCRYKAICRYEQFAIGQHPCAALLMCRPITIANNRAANQSQTVITCKKLHQCKPKSIYTMRSPCNAWTWRLGATLVQMWTPREAYGTRLEDSHAHNVYKNISFFLSADINTDKKKKKQDSAFNLNTRSNSVTVQLEQSRHLLAAECNKLGWICEISRKAFIHL